MEVPVISTDNSTVTVDSFGLLLTFKLERNAKFQLEVNANEDVIIFPAKYTGPLNSL